MIHRVDIQILRGISVILVVLYHINISWFPGGYLGVDVFFVISGFLMALMYAGDDKRIFFLRRASRLIPSYSITLTLTIIACSIITTPSDFRQIEIQSGYAAFLASNIGYWLDNSYFVNVDFKPLLHFWSLGVEYQFYIFVPLIYWISKNNIRFVYVIGAASFVGCVIILLISPKTSFFMLPFRVWQFLIGYLIALKMTNNGTPKTNSFTWLGVIAFIGLLYTASFDIASDQLNFFFGHPGFRSVIVSLLSSIILAYGIPYLIIEMKVSKLVSKIGDYSYSIYLTHFPVLVLYLYLPFEGTNLEPGSAGKTFSAFILIIAISILFYYLIEKPSRNLKLNFLGWGCLLITPLIISFIFSKVNLLNISSRELLISNAYSDRGIFRCGKEFRIFNPTAKSCNIFSTSQSVERSYLLVGNSHADAIKNALITAAKTKNFEVRLMVSYNSLINDGLNPQNLIDEALLHKTTSIVVHSSPNSIDVSNIGELSRLARSQNISVVFIAPIPVWKDHIPKSLWNHLRNEVPLPIQSLNDYYIYNFSYLNKLKSYNYDNLHIYNVSDIFCSPQCKIIDESGRPLYFDNNHLTLTGADLLRPLFLKIMDDDLARDF